MLKEKCYVPIPASKTEMYMAYIGGVEGYDDFDKLPESYTREEMYWRRMCANLTDLGVLGKKETTEETTEEPTEEVDLSAMTKAELKNYAVEHDIDLAGAVNKEDILSKIQG